MIKRLLVIILISASVLSADEGTRRIVITGKKEATVTTSQIRLSDIASVSSANSEDDEAVIALKKIIVERSPSPGKQSSLSGLQIVETLKANQVSFENVGYRFPNTITVSRAARTLSEPELEAVVMDAISRLGRDISLKTLLVKDAVAVPPGEIQLEVEPFDTSNPRRLGFNGRAISLDGSDSRFTIEAEIDEWRDVPVAKRPISKGQIVMPEDVMRARLNLAAIARDAEREENSIVGMQATRNIGYGEVFSTNKLFSPPLINAGSRVNMICRGNSFEATASGMALDAGALGQKIRVRNEASKKIVTGVIVSGELVEVKL